MEKIEKWDFFFASLVGWSLHPGYLRAGTDKLTISDMALMADEMLEESNGRFFLSRRDRSVERSELFGL